ncbi:DMT family transporter [Flavobacteriaceae bacterium]|jgi:drug/metabolite transporter (DMT)-like permease|nr:EamA family transporter [Flavobacteriaceae bacterium]MBT6654033.1 EamA family transporter [Flavobacteriaceae bacterium]MDA8587709.1 DMT family transporter [Flavobacteriaceae bacterium]MDB0022500.1 DMT family transporter [Flavobacteriaceae bacterium]MDB2567628.1 DMT family transporter [Flavobacteriaceae bacterium]|tara:strand:- start:413 stop:1288 length:876 start_codon:yes stop_codon:yes gene_type:complete
MENKNLKWIYLLILSFVWGSSYILIKKALIGLSPLQVGSLRTIISTVLLLAIGYSSLKSIPRDKWKWILITGLVSFIPPFLFAYAQTEIDSALAAILNSLTPLATLLIGVGFYRFKIDSKQISGVIIGLIGSVLLMYQGSVINPDQNLLYVFFIIFASVLYAVQVNLLKVHLQDVSAVAITVGNFIFIFPLAVVIFLMSDYKQIDINDEDVKVALFCLLILSIIGTVFAKILFNKFVQIASPVFASSVTYTLPIVALFWGLIDGEVFTLNQFFATVIILIGVYLANKKSKL